MTKLIIAAAALTIGALYGGPVFAAPTICTQHSVIPTYFSPNRDGIKDITRISFKLAVNAHVKVSIVNSSGTSVRVLLDADKRASSTPYSLTFNGRNSAGKALADGKYRYIIIASDSSGRQSLSRPFVIDRVAPSLTRIVVTPPVFWPNGDGFREKAYVWYRMSEGARTALRATTSRGSVLRRYAFAWQWAGSRSRSWDGRNFSGRACSYGTYKLVFTARDRAANKTLKVLRVRISPFSDVMGQPSTFRTRILRLVGRKVLAPHGSGWFTGRNDGTFGPKVRLRRGDLAVGIVRTFGWQGQSAGTVTFSDVPRTSPLFRYAAIAVRRGAMGYANARTKTFAPGTRVTAAQTMVSIVKALGLSRLANNIRAQDRNTPYYVGYSVIAGDLGLRWRYTGIFPRSSYNRREFALSLNEKIDLGTWQIDKMKAMFGSVAARPIAQSRRQRAITNTARQLIGYPYVWGGESFGEGGFDCSGFVYQVFHSKLGYRILRTSYDAGADSRYPKIGTIAALKPGDTVYFASLSTGRIGHTGIYLGNRYFIHSTRSRGGVSIDRFDSRVNSYWGETFVWGRRIIPVVKLTGVRLSATTIKPPSGSPASTRLYYRISKRSKVTSKVYRGSVAVRTLSNTWRDAGARSLVWNARNSSGAVVPSGRYRIRLVVRDEESNYATASRYVTVVR